MPVFQCTCIAPSHFGSSEETEQLESPVKGHWDGWGWGGEAERAALLTVEDEVEGIETHLARPMGATRTLQGQEATAVRRETCCTQRRGSSL